MWFNNKKFVVGKIVEIYQKRENEEIKINANSQKKSVECITGIALIIMRELEGFCETGKRQ